MVNTMGIRRYDFVEFYVGSARMTAYWFVKALGLDLVGYMGPETGVRDRVSYYLTSEELKFVITSPVDPGCFEIYNFITRHGDGVKRWAVEVDSVTEAFTKAVKNGAVIAERPHKLEDDKGFVEEAAIKLYDSAEIVFVNRDNYNGVFRPKYCAPRIDINIDRVETGLIKIDHIVGNVRENEMDTWANYFNKAMDFETFVDFKPGDIATQYSALLSKVVRTKDTVIRNPINEPYEGRKKSQIEEYIEQYHGSGIQHIAITTKDIIKTIDALRKNGVEFLVVPDTYYESLKKREDLDINEDIEDLRRLGILCDLEGDGYLLQLFTKPTSDRPTFFFEFIQRTGNSQGFGKGNFQALFEAIELEQKLRGNLDREGAADMMPPC